MTHAQRSFIEDCFQHAFLDEDESDKALDNRFRDILDPRNRHSPQPNADARILSATDHTPPSRAFTVAATAAHRPSPPDAQEQRPDTPPRQGAGAWCESDGEDGRGTGWTRARQASHASAHELPGGGGGPTLSTDRGQGLLPGPGPGPVPGSPSHKLDHPRLSPTEAHRVASDHRRPTLDGPRPLQFRTPDGPRPLPPTMADRDLRPPTQGRPHGVNTPPPPSHSAAGGGGIGPVATPPLRGCVPPAPQR